jgi:hypothetical protein
VRHTKRVSPAEGSFWYGVSTETNLGSESERRRRGDVRSEAEDNPVGSLVPRYATSRAIIQ